MPIYDFACVRCTHRTEELFLQHEEVPHSLVCPKCGDEAVRAFPLIAKPATLDHMGRVGDHLGVRGCTSRKEVDAVLQERGMVSSHEVRKQLDEYDPDTVVNQSKEESAFFSRLDHIEKTSDVPAAHHWDMANPPKHLQVQKDNIHKAVMQNAVENGVF